MTTNLAASIHARLLNRAQARSEDFNLILTRFALERFLYRLSQTASRDRFWLKGALLFDLWFNVPHRPTRDADFLGIGNMDAAWLNLAMQDTCATAVVEDAMQFDPARIAIDEIRENARYGGLRIKLEGALGNARVPVQLDIGFGDAVVPGPEEAIYPTLLDGLPAPTLRVYPRAVMAAEKVEAIVSLGMANTRLKDYFDLLALAREGQIDPAAFGNALRATFARRGTALPLDMPLGLSDVFAMDATRQKLWAAFLNRNRLSGPALPDVINTLRQFVAAPLAHARNGKPSL
jgi:hypothetical protein